MLAPGAGRRADHAAAGVGGCCTNSLRSLGFPDTLHALRHRAATEMLRASRGDLRLTQAFLGHANLATLDVYTRVRPDELAAAAAALGRPPAPAAAAQDGGGPHSGS